MTIIPDLPNVLIKHVHVAGEVTVTLATTSPTARCPCCGAASSQVQSRYRHTLHDLPSSGMEQVAAAFRQPDPLEALDDYILIFGRFWDSDRLVTRRIHGLAALDPDFERVVRARDERRRQGLHILVGRLIEKYGRPAPSSLDEAVDVLYTLISFECFDTLAGPTRSIEEVSPVVQRLARTTLGLDEG